MGAMQLSIIASLAIFFALVVAESNGQKLIGLVAQKNSKGIDEPLPGANVYWAGTTKGTTTHENGVFLIDRMEGNDKLVISFVGYKADTISVINTTAILDSTFIMQRNNHFMPIGSISRLSATPLINLRQGLAFYWISTTRCWI